MLLRRTLDQIVPQMPGESRLSPESRRVLFRGRYFGLGVKATELQHSTINYSDDGPDRIFDLGVVRTYRTGKSLPRGGAVSERDLPHLASVLEEYNQVGTLNRVNRIEEIGRQVKATAAVLAIVGAAIWATASYEGNNSVDSSVPIHDCEQVIEGNEVLLPVNESQQVDALQQSDEIVCLVGDREYMLSPGPRQ